MCVEKQPFCDELRKGAALNFRPGMGMTHLHLECQFHDPDNGQLFWEINTKNLVLIAHLSLGGQESSPTQSLGGWQAGPPPPPRWQAKPTFLPKREKQSYYD